MGLVKKIITYGTLLAIGAGIGTSITKCDVERKYDLIPKEGVEEKYEIDYVNSRNNELTNVQYQINK